MIIDIILPLSLVFIMFTLGLGLTIDDFKNIIREPKAFGLGILNQMFILPLVAFCIVLIFKLSNEMAVGMMILACCPGGVTSNIITKLAKGDTALSISFTALVSIISVITLPIIVGSSMQYFLASSAPEINILTLGLTMFLVTTLPVILGLFINTKYKWGEKNFNGVDCSGLVQIAYRLIGINLPRDASQQIEYGNEITDINKSKIGDLAFFNNEKGAIIHVGILIGKNKIIHASGKVRIDNLDKKGIINKLANNYTHTLNKIKRIL